MTLVKAYAIGRLAFGAAAMLAPAATGRVLAGEGAETPDAQTFLRGMGGREIGLGIGLLRAEQEGAAAAPWLLAGMCSDAGDIAGIAGAWPGLAPGKRGLGLAAAAAAAIAGGFVLVASR